jgi:hypothetical protein
MRKVPEDFLAGLYRYCESGEIEFRCLPSKWRFFVSLDNFQMPSLPNENVFFGVGTRNGSGTGTKNELIAIPAIWADVDYKDTTKEKLQSLIKEFPFKPSAVVRSGGGNHIYFFLREPADRTQLDDVENINRRLAAYFGGDLQAVDASRILRLPGTRNHKYDPARRVEISYFNPDLRYDFSDFDFLPDVEATKPGNGNTQGWQNDLLGGVPKGSRNASATRLAGRYLSKGLTLQETLDLLSTWNSRNKPPLSVRNLRTIVESVNKTHARNHPPEQNPLAFPEQVLAGFAGDLARFFNSYLEAPRRFFFIASLAALGSVISDRVAGSSEVVTRPNIYVVLLADSAGPRKSTAISKTVDFFCECLTDFSMCWGVGSAEGLQKQLEESPRLLLCIDEFKQFLNKCKIDNSTLLPATTTLFESTRYQSRTKNSQIKITNGHLSILAASTISTYENAWTTQFTDIGFNNRLFLVPGNETRKYSFPPRIPEPEKAPLKEMLGRILKHVGNHLELDMTPTAKALYHDWYMNLDKSVHAKRLDGYAVRFMILMAVNQLKREIDEEAVQQATTLCDWQLNVRKLYDPIDADSNIAKMEERIRRTLKANGPLKDYEIKQKTAANRAGLYIYDAAKNNLLKAREIRFDGKTKRFGMAG